MKVKRRRYTVQIKSEFTEEEAEKIDLIVKKYRFRSRYQLIQTVIRVFLKNADPTKRDEINSDVQEMFSAMEIYASTDFDDTKSRRGI